MLHPDLSRALPLALAVGLLLPQEGAPPVPAPAPVPVQESAPEAKPRPAPAPLARVPAPAGTPQERWTAALTAPDLDRRERLFDELVLQARGSGELRGWLAESARDASAPDLAWTARLALRELGRAPQWIFAPAPVARETERFRAESQARREAVERASRFRRLTLERGPDGVRVVVVEDGAAGETEEREYEAPTLQALIEAERGVGAELRLLIALEERQEQALAEAPATDRLGVWVLAPRPDVAARRGVDAGTGQLVVDVIPGSIANLIGLGRGDLVVRVNERTIDSDDAISEALAARPAGEAVRVEWVDASGERRVRVWRPAPVAPQRAVAPVEPLPVEPPPVGAVPVERVPTTAPPAGPAPEAPAPIEPPPGDGR